MEQVAKWKTTWNLAPVLQIFQKIPENYCPRLYLSIGQVWWLTELSQKMYSKMHPVSSTNTHHNITDLVWLKIQKLQFLKTEHIFLQNQKINLCLRWQIFGSYRFLVEVTFKVKVKNADFIQCNIFLVYLNETSSLQIDRHGSWVRSKYSRNLKFKYSNYSIMSCPLITKNLKKLLL